MQPETSIRLDKWLWHARFCKTRGVAARLVATGAVRLNSAPVLKPAHPVRVGDGLAFAQGAAVRVVRVRGLGARRGPAGEARQLYDEVAPVAPGDAPGP